MKIPDYKSTLLVVVLLIATAFTARAATCTVPSATYPTIQSAINDSVCDPINVAPGVYNENLSIQRALTLNGAQAGQLVAGRTSGGPVESVLRGANPTGSVPVVFINATHVTVDGFTLTNSVTADAAIGIQLTPISTYTTITNNIVDGINTADPVGIAEAVFIESGAFSTLIDKDLLQNISGSQSARGVVLGDGTANLLSPMNLQYSTINGVTSANGGAYGVLLLNALDNNGLFLSYNDFSNLEGSTLVHGLSLENHSMVMGAIFNTYTNLIGPATDNKAIWFSANDPDVYHADVSASTFNLAVASYGVAIDPSVNVGGNMVNAGCCWWGSPDGPGPIGPGHGARVSPNVIYSPWRITPSLTEGCAGNNVPTTEAQCKNGGWTRTAHPDGTPFKNQGDCMQYVNSGH